MCFHFLFEFLIGSSAIGFHLIYFSLYDFHHRQHCESFHSVWFIMLSICPFADAVKFLSSLFIHMQTHLHTRLLHEGSLACVCNKLVSSMYPWFTSWFWCCLCLYMFICIICVFGLPFLLTYLLPSTIDPLRLQAGGRRRWPNLVLGSFEFIFFCSSIAFLCFHCISWFSVYFYRATLC